MFNGRHVLTFLAVVAGVESFTNTLTNTPAFCASNSKVVCKPSYYAKKGLVLNSSVENAESVESEETPEAAVEETTEAVAEVTEEAVAEVAEEAPKPKTFQRGDEDIARIAYVVNLSYETPGYKLRELFNQHGEVQKLFMPKQKETGRPKGIAFVTMKTEEERDLTIEKLNESEVDGRTIYVDKAKPRSEKGEKRVSANKKLYVGNISYETTKPELIEFFGEYGKVHDVYIPLDKENRLPRGFAFVTMGCDDADKAIEGASGTDLQGRTIDVKESLPRGQKTVTATEKKNANEVKLYIGNLSFDTEEDTLRSLFEEFGSLIDLYMPLDRFSGRPRGFAFVTMSRDDAPNAIDATDGLELDGRILRVNEAQPKGYTPPRYEEGDWDEEGDWNEEE